MVSAVTDLTGVVLLRSVPAKKIKKNIKETGEKTEKSKSVFSPPNPKPNRNPHAIPLVCL